jgi:hypothetical protein
MQFTVDVPGELGQQLADAGAENFNEILALCLREWRSQQAAEFPGLNAVIERLAELPEPAEVLALRPSPEMQLRASELLAKSKNGGLSAQEEAEWQRLEFVEHIVRMAKARATLKLNRS